MPRRNRNTFLQQLQQRRQEAATPSPAEKPVSELTEQELDEEAERIRGELRRMKEEEVAAARQEQASSENRWPFPRRKTKRPWK
jgi:hypothetical protein